jgi:hypothetical protein
MGTRDPLEVRWDVHKPEHDLSLDTEIQPWTNHTERRRAIQYYLDTPQTQDARWRIGKDASKPTVEPWEHCQRAPRIVFRRVPPSTTVDA